MLPSIEVASSSFRPSRSDGEGELGREGKPWALASSAECHQRTRASIRGDPSLRVMYLPSEINYDTIL